MTDAMKLIERLRDLDPHSWEWQTTRDELAERDTVAYGQWLHDMQALRLKLRAIEEASSPAA